MTLTDLQPFGSVEYCPKCGASTHCADRKWMASTQDWRVTHLPTRDGEWIVSPECLCITCGTCGYQWRERTKDAK